MKWDRSSTSSLVRPGGELEGCVGRMMCSDRSDAGSVGESCGTR